VATFPKRLPALRVPKALAVAVRSELAARPGSAYNSALVARSETHLRGRAMRLHRLLIATAAVGVLLALPAAATELGDDAPPLKVEKWFKGGPVDLAAGKGKNIHLVEFWATWCGPCRRSIPHLTEVQKKFKDKGVVVIGVSVDEDKKRKTRDKVEEFVKEQGDKMEYAVALDDKDRSTDKAYMEEFKCEGIPTAFLVDKAGKLVWLGHPDEAEPVLEQVLAGEWDLVKAKKDDKERRAEVEKRQKVEKALTEYFELARADEKPANLEKAGEETLAAVGKDAMALNQLAWTILDDPEVKHRDLKFALKVAKLAYDACEGKEAAIVDTYARALWDTGDKKEAIEYQKKAVKLAKDSKAPDELTEDLEQTLKRYQKEAK
jgi:thiol-disulfide isomerase/thioredoxin